MTLGLGHEASSVNEYYLYEVRTLPMFLHQKDIDRTRRTDGQGDFYLPPPPLNLFSWSIKILFARFVRHKKRPIFFNYFYHITYKYTCKCMICMHI